MNRMLSSWKEIAHFFGKGVRTVQRWEKTLDLPIRRPPGAPSNVVLARTSDLEEWMHRSAGIRDVPAEPTRDVESDALQTAIAELESEVRRLVAVSPQPMEALTSDTRPEPSERIAQVTILLRSWQRNEHNGLKRVA